MIIAVPLGILVTTLYKEGVFKTAEQSVILLFGRINELRRFDEKELEEILKCERHGLVEEYFIDQYVWLIDKNGKDLNYRGFHNDVNIGEQSPYIVCKTHTKEAWEKYYFLQMFMGTCLQLGL